MLKWDVKLIGGKPKKDLTRQLYDRVNAVD